MQAETKAEAGDGEGGLDVRPAASKIGEVLEDDLFFEFSNKRNSQKSRL